MADLQKLVQHRQDILLAEVAAWLHDWQKCIDGTVASHWRYNPHINLQKIQEWQERTGSLKPGEFASVLRQDILDICEKKSPLQLKSLIEEGREPSKASKSSFLLVRILGQAHDVAHVEKELEEDENKSLATDWISSPFGWEFDQPDGLLHKLLATKKQLRKFFSDLSPKSQDLFLRQLQAVFWKAWGDNRRPINEVTLWDWSSIVAALYKAEVARCVLTSQQRAPQDIAWRLLSIRTNGLEYLLSTPSIPDLLARKDLLTDAWNRVQKVLEEEYPLGLEVYRDENGPVFVVPDLDNLLGLSNSADNHKTLREYILGAFRQGTVKGDLCLAIDGEIVPDFKVDQHPWKGQPAPQKQKLPPIWEHLQEIPVWQSDPEAIAQRWCNLPRPEEICTVCGLRPQGPGQKAKDRKMCDVCEKRRADRAKAWAEGASLSPQDRFKQGKPDTIWLDEVADRNGRLALIVGTFDLTHWLDGTLVRSLAVRTPNDQNGHTDDKVAKNPSFARLRRIWETTRRFWQEVAPTDAPPKELQNFCDSHKLDLKDLWTGPLSLKESLAGRAIGEKRSRLFLEGKLIQGDLGPFHAYEMVVQGRKVAVLWVPPGGEEEKSILDDYRGGFWVIENLEYLKTRFGRDFREVLDEEKTYEIYEPSEYGRPGRAAAQFEVKKQREGPCYVPLIPILAEPRTFMALVPADKAIAVVQAIKAKYEREMGKVRNRLPLHLGIIFADAHQPLRTVLDAGQRMLERKIASAQWVVVGDQEKGNLESKGIYLEHITATNEVETQLEQERPDLIYEDPQKRQNRLTEQYKKWHRIVLYSQQMQRVVTWYVPAVMGDGRTEDHWYPYVFLESQNAPTGRTRYYEAENPWNKKRSWLVHAAELQPGDVIYFTPATLDFIWLDRGGRRFEIAYDQEGRRLGTLRRPYLLDELDDLVECWELLAGKEDGQRKIRRLSSRQIHIVRDLIEGKRAEWFENPLDSVNNETFLRFCESVLRNAEWQTKPEETEFKRLIHWAITGLLADAVELFYHILKQRPVGEEE